MAKSGCRIGCCVFFVLLGLLCVAAGIFLWAGFNKIYDRIVDQSIVLQAEPDGQLTKSTFWFAHPPVDTLSFYRFFHMVNPEGVEFRGEKPWVQEVGPFAIRVVDNKWNYSFSEDGNTMRYRNYKTFIFDKNNSCDDCSYDQMLTLPNLVGIGTVEELLDPRYNVSTFEAELIDLFMLLVGEYPFIRVRMGDILFDGYEDALLAAAHSQLLDDLAELNGGRSIIPVPVPDMKTMAMFYHYNNTNDEEYEVFTGKDELSNVGRIANWAKRAELPAEWWPPGEARQIRGSDSGGFQAPRMRKEQQVELFMSYMCRSFVLNFTGVEKSDGFELFRYEGGGDNYDTLRSEQAGFRYSNSEVVDYFPEWPQCPTASPNGNCTADLTDCSKVENMCSPCCSGSFFDGTFQLPPGFYPINCFPGRVKETPFRLLFTTPHFGLSPPEVRDSIKGLKDLGERAQPFDLTFIPRTGSMMGANIRFQIAIPIYQTRLSIMCSNFPNKIVPVLWVDSSVKMHKNAYDKFHTGIVVIPRLVNVFKFVLPAVGILFIAIGVAILFVRRKYESLQVSAVPSRRVSKL
ncbi:hypothetical protein M3Y99_01920800 [Aphelenchoides fujianensis]|nr:hypothetical protein M3Y99_01920800 [Aphelenchoides fujianensis]